MECKEAEKKIPLFLQDELEGRELDDFIQHIDSCSECREELTIQFLVAEVMERLEEGDNFNLQKALQMKMEESRHRVRLYHILLRTLAALEAAVVAAAVIAVYMMFQFNF